MAVEQETTEDMGTYTIMSLAGDGIGPDVTAEAIRALWAVARRYGHTLRLAEALVGQEALTLEGAPISEATIKLCGESDAVLFGAVGTLDAASSTTEKRPESAILRLRRALGLFANIRPARVLAPAREASPLRPERLNGVDLLMVRELTGGLYFGRPSEIRQGAGRMEAIDTMMYTEEEIERIVRVAFAFARERRRRVTSVDKANVLNCSRLWRSVTDRVAAEYPDVEVRHLLVDACAMELLRSPAQFDVIVTENLFGDILSDEASMLVGSLGMLPSASLGMHQTAHGRFGLYEPIHGSAPDIAGRGVANPIGAILSAALLLRYSLGLHAEASAVETAVETVLAEGYRTADMSVGHANVVSTRQMGEAIAARIERL